MRNLEIIGEAVKVLSSDFRKKHQGVPWQDIAGMRDRLIHDYAGVNWDIVWDVLQTKLPELRRVRMRHVVFLQSWVLVSVHIPPSILDMDDLHNLSPH